MDTAASIVDSFLSAAEAKADEARRRRDEKLKAAHGAYFDGYERELLPVLNMLAALPPRAGDVLTVRHTPDALGFSIEQMTDTREGASRESFTYQFSSGADNSATHKVVFRQETKTRFGNIGPEDQPKTFADVGVVLAAWVAEKIPHRLSELRDIARRANNGDMQLDRTIKTGGPLKLKAGQA